MTQELIQPAHRLTDRERWAAITGRDARFDGAFVYAVRSTGVYCLPSCPSRNPRRDNVDYFAIPESAEQAGYRACRRCRPRTHPAADPQIERVRRACRFIEDYDEGTPTLNEIGVHVGLSPHHLQRQFKKVVGISPREFADCRRVAKVKALLREGDGVAGALYEAGYGSASRLYEGAAARLGMTPATYKKGGAGAHIRYAFADAPLGLLLVAATERGVCFVCLGDDHRGLMGDLSAEFPAADIGADEGALDDWVAEVLRRLDGKEPSAALPLDVRASAFQWRVWQELCAIPVGETRSYGQIAEALGQPKAQRAVGRACATNPVSIVVPCHRATRGDGSLGGYRWGVKRKAALLDVERESDASALTAREDVGLRDEDA